MSIEDGDESSKKWREKGEDNVKVRQLKTGNESKAKER